MFGEYEVYLIKLKKPQIAAGKNRAPSNPISVKKPRFRTRRRDKPHSALAIIKLAKSKHKSPSEFIGAPSTNKKNSVQKLAYWRSQK